MPTKGNRAIDELPPPLNEAIPSAAVPPVLAPAAGETAPLPAKLVKKKKWWGVLLRVTIFLVTVAAFAWQIHLAAAEIRNPDFHLQWNFGWLSLAVSSYALGLTVLGLPFSLLVREYDQGVSWPRLIATYLISHAGKYVPGKAMAIVIRCVLLGPTGVTPAVATVTSFYETFATMASGSLLAALVLTFLPLPAPFTEFLAQQPVPLVLGVWGLAAGFLGAIVPPLFQLLVRLVTAPFKGVRQAGDHRFAWLTFGLAVVIGVISWTIQGFSYLAAVNAVVPQKLGLEALPLCAACFAVSIVGGFLSMLPGGPVVREVILIESLTPLLGLRSYALAASVVHRLVTLLTELALAAILYPQVRK